MYTLISHHMLQFFAKMEWIIKETKNIKPHILQKTRRAARDASKSRHPRIPLIKGSPCDL